MPSRPDADRLALLQLARAAVRECVLKQSLMAETSDKAVFAERCGVFVTLRIGERLRGCIGVLEGKEPLGRLIPRCAVSAALEDPRFAPVTRDELEELRIELSLLSPLVPSRADDIVIGTHGIMVTCGERRGVLLPQVAAEHDWSVEEFLAQTCQKAGLPRDAWRSPGAEISSFVTEVLREAD